MSGIKVVPQCPACGYDYVEFAETDVACRLCGNTGTVISGLINFDDIELGLEIKWHIPRFYLTREQVRVMKELMDE